MELQLFKFVCEQLFFITMALSNPLLNFIQCTAR